MMQSPTPPPGPATAPVVPERRRTSRLAPDARRAQLLSTARHLVESGRVRQISVEAVAELAGVSPALLFHYFGTQRQFRQAVIGEIAADLLAQLQPDPALSPAGQLHAGLETFIAYVACRPELYLAVIRPADDDLGNLHRSMRSTVASWLVTGLTEAGAPVTAAITMTVAGWIAFTEEALLGWINDPTMTQAELVELCERACLHLLDAAAQDAAERRRLTDALGRRARQAGLSARRRARRRSAGSRGRPRIAVRGVVTCPAPDLRLVRFQAATQAGRQTIYEPQPGGSQPAGRHYRRRVAACAASAGGALSHYAHPLPAVAGRAERGPWEQCQPRLRDRTVEDSGPLGGTCTS